MFAVSKTRAEQFLTGKRSNFRSAGLKLHMNQAHTSRRSRSPVTAAPEL
jgi:hypothetical protein